MKIYRVEFASMSDGHGYCLVLALDAETAKKIAKEQNKDVWIVTSAYPASNQNVVPHYRQGEEG